MKKRLVGAIVLVSLVVIFVPMLLDDEPLVITGITGTNIPPRPKGVLPSHILPEEAKVPLVPRESRIEPTKVVKVKPEPKPTSTAEKSKAKARVGLSAWVVQAGSFGKGRMPKGW